MNKPTAVSRKASSRYSVKRSFCGKRTAQEVVSALIKVHR